MSPDSVLRLVFAITLLNGQRQQCPPLRRSMSRVSRYFPSLVALSSGGRLSDWNPYCIETSLTWYQRVFPPRLIPPHHQQALPRLMASHPVHRSRRRVSPIRRRRTPQPEHPRRGRSGGQVPRGQSRVAARCIGLCDDGASGGHTGGDVYVASYWVDGRGGGSGAQKGSGG